ncbi:methyl-accepting chemotaxis protein [Carboxylicivirga sp. N1Y90]|uniref:methyl-accepting chemotaxis protein n=1 Tax=Carboxylicivirga fragile TaxID=3417571 RepID=UPI003D353566|nr:methyl-accepting chemotaxis protein [Marinilabiliaceae bacterium N1Y90]
MKKLTLRQRFAVLIGVLMLAFVGIGLFTQYSLNRLKGIDEVKDWLQELEIVQLQLRRNEKDFLARSITDINFFEQNESKYVTSFSEKIAEITALCEKLEASPYLNDDGVKEKLLTVHSYFSEYEVKFDQLTKSYHQLGFKDWGKVGEMRSAIKTVETIIQSLDLDKAEIMMLTLRRREKDFLIRKDITYRDRFNADVIEFKKVMEKSYLSQSKRSEVDELISKYASTFNAVVDNYVLIGLTPYEGHTGEMRSVVSLIEPEVDEISSVVQEIIKLELRNAMLFLVLFIVIASTLVIALVVIMIRQIFNVLGAEPSEVAEIADNIAKGNLHFEFNDKRKNIGVMASMMLMANKLEDLISQVLLSSNQIVVASEQLSETSAQISAGATQQASSVEEISSTVEEISSNIQQNSSNAQETSKIAQSAQGGINSVNEHSVKTVNANRLITEKIQVINDIAFQTNLLALNASVEASRAGEHGRGFSVVASEVRKLAELSKVAATDIEGLAMNTLDLSENSNKQLNSLLPEIEKTTHLIQEITVASSEQTSGVQQVNSAIQELNSITQENASVSEEMAASSKELEGQATRMKELISFFKTKNVSA